MTDEDEIATASDLREKYDGYSAVPCFDGPGPHSLACGDGARCEAEVMEDLHGAIEALEQREEDLHYLRGELQSEKTRFEKAADRAEERRQEVERLRAALQDAIEDVRHLEQHAPEDHRHENHVYDYEQVLEETQEGSA